MATVEIIPLPACVRELPARLRPQHPPVFTDGPPSLADVELARELFLALDDESRAWYGGEHFLARLRQRTV